MHLLGMWVPSAPEMNSRPACILMALSEVADIMCVRKLATRQCCPLIICLVGNKVGRRRLGGTDRSAMVSSCSRILEVSDTNVEMPNYAVWFLQAHYNAQQPPAGAAANAPAAAAVMTSYNAVPLKAVDDTALDAHIATLIATKQVRFWRSVKSAAFLWSDTPWWLEKIHRSDHVF